MKKTLSLLLLLSVTILSTKAQKSVILNAKYLPNTNYALSTIMDMDMKMDFKGDTAKINAIKKNGLALPMIMHMTYDMASDIKTSAANKKKEYPLLITYNKMDIKGDVNGQSIPMPPNSLPNSKIYGKYNSIGKMELDSMNGKAIDEATKKALLTTIGDLQKQINFPSKAITVGESFTQDVPMNLPIAGNNTEMLINATYKLSRIQKGIAYFDVNQVIKMDVPATEAAMKMTGIGDGKLEYSLKDKFMTVFNTNFKFNYTMQKDDLTIVGEGDMKMKYSVKVN